MHNDDEEKQLLRQLKRKKKSFKEIINQKKMSSRELDIAVQEDL